MSIATKAKKWGTSMAVIIPFEDAQRLNLKPGEDVMIDIQKKSTVLKDLFGSLKFKKNTEQILKEVREDLEGKWLKEKNA